MASLNIDTLANISGYRMESGGYVAFICPEFGANCIQLKTNKASYLRTPENYEQLKNNPYLYGMPILFPPNRINGGTFHYNGFTYNFPINEKKRGHHIHGYLSFTRFTLFEYSNTDQYAKISFSFEATRAKPYLSFPHFFKIIITYRLDTEGLHQSVKIENTGNSSMPCGIGFHTTFNETFLQNTNGDEYTLYLQAEKEILFDRKTIIPTGGFCTQNQMLKELNEGILSPSNQVLSNLFVPPIDTIKEAVYTHKGSKIALRYLVESPFNFWMLFNGGGKSGFLCVEPQTWTIDAPNSSLAPTVSGFRTIPPRDNLILFSTLQQIN